MHSMKIQEENEKLNQYLLNGEFGIEKESLRVDVTGRLATTEHPSVLPEQISRDFSESQVEFISGVHTSIQEACEEICMLQNIVEENIRNRTTGPEYIWTYSNPPAFEEKNIRIAEFEGERKYKTTYREYLAEKYGKVKMLYSGVHLNYSMPKEFFEALKEQMPQKNVMQIKSDWYLKLADLLMSDSWLLVALTAASPTAGADFLEGLNVPREEWGTYASFRNSIYGYWNHFVPELCYTSFEGYLNSIERYVKSGAISSVQELYYPIRLKPLGENTLENLREKGVNHIELRMLDLNPFCCAGVAIADLIFIHLLIGYRIAKMEDVNQNKASDRERILLHQKAARINFWEEEPRYKKYALELLSAMKEFYADYMQNEKKYIPADYAIMEVLEFQEKKILNRKTRYASKVSKNMQTG